MAVDGDRAPRQALGADPLGFGAAPIQPGGVLYQPAQGAEIESCSPEESAAASAV